MCWLLLALVAAAQSDTSVIRRHLIAITKTPAYRTHRNIEQLNATAAYIREVFAKYGDTVYEQEFVAESQLYRNVICSFRGSMEGRVIVGAHYDVCTDQEGADDNASGVTGLLELARLLQGKKLRHPVDLVAYSLEEPPYFRSQFMGSYIHARSLALEKVKVYGMISLEMIGYFSDDKHSQTYPAGFLSLVYGNKGNYITLVRKFGSGTFVRKFSRAFRSMKMIRTKTFTGPRSLAGVDFSDHLNYWIFGYSALMITDTSFYRNPNYHGRNDTMETLDLNRMAKVIDSVAGSLCQI
jgi:hypothetical protein